MCALMLFLERLSKYQISYILQILITYYNKVQNICAFALSYLGMQLYFLEISVFIVN